METVKVCSLLLIKSCCFGRGAGQPTQGHVEKSAKLRPGQSPTNLILMNDPSILIFKALFSSNLYQENGGRFNFGFFPLPLPYWLWHLTSDIQMINSSPNTSDAPKNVFFLEIRKFYICFDVAHSSSAALWSHFEPPSPIFLPFLEFHLK